MKKLLALVTLATFGLMGLAMATTASADPEAHSWYVCKYVNKPGPREVIQTGQNPIFVDEHAIMAQTGLPDVHIGDQFADAQTLSVVVAGPEAPPGVQPGPGVEICGVSHPTTTTSQPPPPPTTTSQPPPPPTTTVTKTTSSAPPPVTSTSSAPPPVTTSTTAPPPVTTSTTVPPPVTSTTVPPPVTSTTVPPPVTTTVTTPPAVTTTTATTPPPVIVPPPVTTTTTTTTTAPPPTVTIPPPPPPDEQPPPDNQPPPDHEKPPPLAFTGPRDYALPLGLVALAMLCFGVAMVWMSRREEA